MSDLYNASSISVIFVIISLLWGAPSLAVQAVGAQGHQSQPDWDCHREPSAVGSGHGSRTNYILIKSQ